MRDFIIIFSGVVIPKFTKDIDVCSINIAARIRLFVDSQVRVWRDGTHIKNATDYDAAKETDLHISGLRHDVLYKLRVFGYSRAGDGTMSSPTVKFQLGQYLEHDIRY